MDPARTSSLCDILLNQREPALILRRAPTEGRVTPADMNDFTLKTPFSEA